MEVDGTEIESLINDLSQSIDGVEEAFQPLLQSSLEDLSSKLPLLDKAKLHLMLAYSIHSLVFSSLKLDGVDAKEHPVYTELTRIKQYFEKIKKAEEGPAQDKTKLSVDKDAAGRIIKHALNSGKASTNKQPVHTRFGESDSELDIKSRKSNAAVQESTSETDEREDKKRKRDELSSNAYENRGSASKDRKDQLASVDVKQQQPSRHQKHGKKFHHGKAKSSQAPKSSSDVFKHLLNKSHGTSKSETCEKE